MQSPKDIKSKIGSIEKIKKMTRAMQNVAIGKMSHAKQHMLTSIPYATKIREVAQHLANDVELEEHPYLGVHRQRAKCVGYMVVATDQGMCGGLNLNLFKMVLKHAETFYQHQGVKAEWCLFGKKATSFFKNIGVPVVAQIDSLGNIPRVENVLGAVKVMLDSYRANHLDCLYIAHNEFISTLIQRPIIQQLLPLQREERVRLSPRSYIYEYPGPPATLLDMVVARYIESQVYQALVDNLACEQVARMVAMRSATESCSNIIEELHLIYNKARQNIITNELTEIMGGASSA